MDLRLSRACRAWAALLAVSLFGAALPASAGDVVKKTEFTMTLPDGWVEVPRDAMTPFNANIVHAMPNMPRARVPQYRYGFQPKAAAHWLAEFPYLVVRINTARRIPESEFQQMESVDLNKEMRKHKDELPSFMAKMALGRPLYDPSSHTVWIAGDVPGPDNEPIRALSAMIATKDGFVQLSAYAPKAQFASYYAALHRAMASVVIPPEMRY
jgi:hypothetical protein